MTNVVKSSSLSLQMMLPRRGRQLLQSVWHAEQLPFDHRCVQAACACPAAATELSAGLHSDSLNAPRIPPGPDLQYFLQSSHQVKQSQSLCAAAVNSVTLS